MSPHVEVDLLKDALDSMRDLVLIKGPKSHLLWANKAFLEYYGMSEEELQGIVDGPQSDPDDTLQYVRDDALVFEVESHVDIASEVVTDHLGDQRLFHTIKSPIFRDGQVAYSVGVCRRHDDDEVVTGSPHLEAKALTGPLRMLSTVFPLALLVADFGGRIVAVSPTWEDAFGPIDVGPDSSVTDLPPDLAPVSSLIARPSDAGSSQVLRTSHDGESERFHEFRVAPWSYGDGSTGGSLVVAFDVTAAAVNKTRLEAANDRYNLVLEGASVGIWDWIDVNRSDEYWSPRFYELLGYRPGDIEPSLETFTELLHPDGRRSNLRCSTGPFRARRSVRDRIPTSNRPGFIPLVHGPWRRGP